MTNVEDNGFGSLVDIEENNHKGKKNVGPPKPSLTDVTFAMLGDIEETDAKPLIEKAKENTLNELQNLQSSKDYYSKMCKNGWHGMCTKTIETCSCVCHKNAKRIPIE